MAKIGTAHIEIKPVLNRESLADIVEQVATAVEQGIDIGARRTFPHDSGDVTVLGPEVFASKDGSVICWRGRNYVPQQ